MPIARVLIFCFQIVAIAALLIFAPISPAADNNDGNCRSSRSSCGEPEPKIIKISIPSQYKRNPPDEGFQYTRRIRRRDEGDIIQTVWVPGLTDKMTQENRRKYYDIKKNTSGVAWKYQRRNVADLVQHVQDHPKTECRSHINKTATAVTLVCEAPGRPNKAFSNMVAAQYDGHFGDNMITPVEDFQMANENRQHKLQGPVHENSDGPSRINTSAYETPAPASTTFGVRHRSGSSQRATAPSGQASAASSAYSSYISSQVAANNSYAARPIAPAFANTPNAKADVTTIENEKVKNSSEAAGTSSQGQMREGATKSGTSTFGSANRVDVGRSPASERPSEKPESTP